MERYTMKDAEMEINEIGCPNAELKSEGGLVPDRMVNRYGTWMRKHDPIAFNVYYHDEKREKTGGI